MDARFIPVETVPGKTPFGLDQLRRSYKTALSATDAIAAAPDVGDVDDSFSKMFLTSVTTPESAESATRIDLIYQGCMRTSGGAPVLPDVKHDSDDAVQSASSSRSSDGRVATSPVSLQFYAPTNEITYYSFGGAGSAVAADPSDNPEIISLTISDTALAVGEAVDYLVSVFFSVQIVETHKSDEIVPGKYWLNRSTKTKSYTAFITNLPTGPYLVLYHPGSGYAIGNTLTITGTSGIATISITQIGISGSITGWSQISNTFTAAQTNIPAVGGSGSGAVFNSVVV